MTQVIINSPNARTPVNVVDGIPDLTAYTDPTLSILQAGFDAGDYEVVPEPEPIVEIPLPNWIQFYKSLKVSATYQYLIGLSVQVPNISGVMAAMGIAIQDGIRDPFDPDIYPAFQASVNGVLYALIAIALPLSTEQLSEVRGLLDTNGFSDIQLE